MLCKNITDLTVNCWDVNIFVLLSFTWCLYYWHWLGLQATATLHLRSLETLGLVERDQGGSGPGLTMCHDLWLSNCWNEGRGSKHPIFGDNLSVHYTIMLQQISFHIPIIYQSSSIINNLSWHKVMKAIMFTIVDYPINKH